MNGLRIDLGSAMLCLEPDCSTVFDRVTCRACPSCGGTAYSLAVWLNRGPRLVRGAAEHSAQQPTMTPSSHAQPAPLWSVRQFASEAKCRLEPNLHNSEVLPRPVALAASSTSLLLPSDRGNVSLNAPLDPVPAPLHDAPLCRREGSRRDRTPKSSRAHPTPPLVDSRPRRRVRRPHRAQAEAHNLRVGQSHLKPCEKAESRGARSCQNSAGW
jgi:hypothetical protein